MVKYADVFSGFSVDDIDAARTFYRDVLGLEVADNAMGFLNISLPAGGAVLVYNKPDHTPASFTILNLAVDDVEAAVDELNARGVATKIYPDDQLPTDAKGIMRGNGPDIAWFTDPAGNVLSVLSD
ncbi:VOC family protein [Plantibacter flavus]|uniref:VOC family protein n=1 Tax=Plantibacter flavus TaxID=150123 RepID=UPI003F16E1C4